jgi:hypothetical protein
MPMFMRKRKAEQEMNWGAMHPARACKWEEDEKGVALLVPRLSDGIVGRRLNKIFNPKPYKAHLDSIGTFVWQRCDGDRTVSEIARAMRSEFGEKAEPVEDRLVQFLRTLARGKFVILSPEQRAD